MRSPSLVTWSRLVCTCGALAFAPGCSSNVDTPTSTTSPSSTTAAPGATRSTEALRSRVDQRAAGSASEREGDVGVRPIAPLSASILATRRPLLRWAQPAYARGARVELCADRACTHVIDSIDVDDDHVQVDHDLPVGVAFWRVAPRQDRPCARPSVTWELFIAAGASATVPASCGTNGGPPAPSASAVGSAVDVDGDGHADAIVAATTPGSVLVFRGGASALATAPATTLDTSAFGTLGGVVNAGDVDGDGFTDLLVANEVHVRLFRGGPTGLETSAAQMVPTTPFFANERHKIAGGFDYDGDGYGDIVIADGPNERALVYFGGASGLSPSPGVVLRASDPSAPLVDAFATAVASAGDVDGDGFGDIVIGAPDAQNGAGRAYLFRGAPRDAVPPPRLAFDAPDAASGAGRFGADVASASDVDGDGFVDLIIGAPSAPNASGFGAGRAYVLRSHAGAFDLPPIALTPPFMALRGLGIGVTGIGDIDGDGFADVAAVASIPTSEAGPLGYVIVFAGSAAGTDVRRTTVLTDTSASGRFGDTLASPGDVDGDARADLLVGARSSPTSLGGARPGAGRVYVYTAGAASSSQSLAGEDYAVRGFGASVD